MHLTGLELQHLTDTFANNRHTSLKAKKGKFSNYVDNQLVDDKFKDPTKYIAKQYHEGNETLWNSIKETFTDPYFAPLMADDLSNLPEAYIVSAQYDVLRDDAVMYANRLEAAGVKVNHNHYKRATHAVYSYELSDVSRKCMDDFLFFVEENI